MVHHLGFRCGPGEPSAVLGPGTPSGSGAPGGTVSARTPPDGLCPSAFCVLSSSEAVVVAGGGGFGLHTAPAERDGLRLPTLTSLPPCGNGSAAPLRQSPVHGLLPVERRAVFCDPLSDGHPLVGMARGALRASTGWTRPARGLCSGGPQALAVSAPGQLS